MFLNDCTFPFKHVNIYYERHVFFFEMHKYFYITNFVYKITSHKNKCWDLTKVHSKVSYPFSIFGFDSMKQFINKNH